MTYLLLFLSVAVGAGIVFLFKPEDKRKIKVLISFAGAYIFTITVLHLLPEAYGATDGTQILVLHGDPGFTIGLLVLAGFFVQLLLEFFSQGIEHGHAHHDHEHSGRIPIGMMAGLCVHAFIEGMPLGGHLNPAHEHSKHMLLAGIIIHNIPVSIVLLTMLLHNGLTTSKALFLMLVFALMSPLGAALSDLAGNLSRYSHELMALVIGIFLHISTTILFESSDEHRFNRLKMMAIVAGAGIAIFTSSL
ncbi:MAG: ZIP family metal transporter [Verrucomicrobiota bacterium]